MPSEVEIADSNDYPLLAGAYSTARKLNDFPHHTQENHLSGDLALLAAGEAGDTGVVEQLLNRGVDVTGGTGTSSHPRSSRVVPLFVTTGDPEYTYDRIVVAQRRKGRSSCID